MKIAVTGKGGVGKTTLSALLAWECSSKGRQVIAIDANPDPNLAMALGIPVSEASKLKPIAELEALISERVEIEKGQKGVFKLNPRVDDIPDLYSIRIENIRLMVMGTVKKGGSGCLCPESTFLKSLLSNLILARSEVIIMDMEAGLEHLGRGTAKGVDAFLIVVDGGQRSYQTARAIKQMSKDIGVKHCYAVGSKTRSEVDRQELARQLTELSFVGFLDYDSGLEKADRLGLGVQQVSPVARKQASDLIERIEELIATRNNEKNS